MSTQLHKNFTDSQVKSFLKSYLDKEIKISYVLQILKIKRRRFFELLAKYRKDPDSFSIQYERKTINRKISKDIERNIVKALKIEKDLIKALNTPRDWNEMDNEQRASVLALSFIGYVVRPKNIPKDILEKCAKAFNDNRGKVEWETEAILKVLEEKK